MNVCRQFLYNMLTPGLYQTYPTENTDLPHRFWAWLTQAPQTQPQDISHHYHLLADLPIHLFLSLNDTLIGPSDEIKHYHAHPTKHLKVFEGFSHIDFTYASHHVILSELLATMRRSFA